MEVAECFGLGPAEVLPSAAAIELIHTISLVHDGLPALDGAPAREAPACHEGFGEATAILAGDAFFGESLALVTARQSGTSEQLIEVVRELAVSTGVDGMVGNQALRIGCGGGFGAPGAARCHEVRTLVGASARIGAILAGATPDEEEAASEYARCLELYLRASEGVANAASRKAAPFVDASARGSPGAWHGVGKALERALEALGRTQGDPSGLAELARFVRRGIGGAPRA
jgi:geranylgeranyl diphosphate synthase type II